MADKPRTASRTREREATGERKISISSLVAAYTDCRYMETSSDRAVTCPVAPAVASASRWRTRSSSQRAGWPGSANTGLMRKACQSSHRAAQNCGFRELAAQGFPGLGGGEHAVFVQGLPQLEHQGRDLVAGGFLRSMLPIGIGAQAKHVGQRLGVGQKIRLLAHRAQQIQRHHAAGGDQPSQQRLRLLDRGRTGSRLRAPHAGFDKRRRGRRQLRPPR